jgi:hypothetical protein
LAPIAPFQWVGRQNLSRFLLRFVRVEIDVCPGGGEIYTIDIYYMLVSPPAWSHRVNEPGVSYSNQTLGSRQAMSQKGGFLPVRFGSRD